MQELRSQAEGRIDAAVTRANELLEGIAEVNGQITAENLRGGSAALEDERDRMLNELAGLMDINVQKGQNGSIMVRTPPARPCSTAAAPQSLSFRSRAPALDAGHELLMLRTSGIGRDQRRNRVRARPLRT